MIMNSTLTNGLILLASIAMLSSCSKNDNFNAGWDQELIKTDVVLDQTSDDQITLGTVNLTEVIRNYMAQNHGDVKSYQVLEVRPTFGLVVSIDVLPLGFIEAIDVYAVSGVNETLIGMLSSGSSQDASLGLAGLDLNLLGFSGNEAVDIVMKPKYHDIGVPESVSAEVRFAFNFLISGSK